VRKRDLSPPSGRGAATRQLLVVPPGPEQPARSSSPIEHRPVAKLPPRNDLRSGTVFAPSTAITGEAGFRSEAVEMLARTRRVRAPWQGNLRPRFTSSQVSKYAFYVFASELVRACGDGFRTGWRWDVLGYPPALPARSSTRRRSRSRCAHPGQDRAPTLRCGQARSRRGLGGSPRLRRLARSCVGGGRDAAPLRLLQSRRFGHRFAARAAALRPAPLRVSGACSAGETRLAPTDAAWIEPPWDRLAHPGKEMRGCGELEGSSFRRRGSLFGGTGVSASLSGRVGRWWRWMAGSG
jgi:hypothetical protein